MIIIIWRFSAFFYCNTREIDACQNRRLIEQKDKYKRRCFWWGHTGQKVDPRNQQKTRLCQNSSKHDNHLEILTILKFLEHQSYPWRVGQRDIFGIKTFWCHFITVSWFSTVSPALRKFKGIQTEDTTTQPRITSRTHDGNGNIWVTSTSSRNEKLSSSDLHCLQLPFLV